MKIYNEILIDMNTGETIYEDSFEHDGEMMLMQELPTVGEHGKDYYVDTYYSNFHQFSDKSQHHLTGQSNDYATHESKGVINDPQTGIKYEVYEARVKDDWHQQRWSGGFDIKVTMPNGEHLFVTAPSGGGSLAATNAYINEKLIPRIDEVGIEEYGWKSADEWRSDYDLNITAGYSVEDARDIASGGDATTFKTKDEKDALQRKIELKQEVASTRQEVEDVTELEAEKAKTEVGRVLGGQARASKAQLRALGYTPEESSQILASQGEASGRAMGDIASQAQILKNKTMADLSKFGISANLSADELGLKMKELTTSKVNLQNQLQNQLTLANINAATQKYGADMSYQSAIESAQMGQTGMMDIFGEMTGEIAGEFGKDLVKWGAVELGKYFAASDIRLKKDIYKVGLSESGINIYEFEYKDKTYGEGKYRGVMAQEVPHASFRHKDGYLWVDYSKLDVNFEKIKD